ncbi:mRNA interferase MazF [Arcanobacterium wilhelmae]|uniref:mRNA interferase MazF n=1 Tax=Arcanobacterium wilhelmae TaxID=1803177 RepID=A0ABT9NCT9_9ACTO|nr:type II toxin-antitoxin system PemK/MazF family toxin [Arcanobacterium wilhelmae]MDP9801535.1 mRNA interferase MazF [Arcanobacterium wilhelmae]WFN90862.1 type II toxin-antitoxin system PemK/MazF family toxin [Arcanobacterium wilhelmae]
MREIRLAKLDKTRPVLILTREIALPAMRKVTVAPITSTIRGLTSEVRVGQRNGLDHECVVALDNITTIPQTLLGKRIGYFFDEQESELSLGLSLAFDLPF